MSPGVVIGRVYGARVYPAIEGVKLLLVQPTDWKKNPVDTPIICADVVGAGAGEFVFYVRAREAAIAFGGTSLKDTLPFDATILGIIDGVQLYV